MKKGTICRPSPRPHQQTNGMVDRFNGCIEEVPQSLIGFDQPQKRKLQGVNGLFN
ncbi:hypothetical protein [Rhodobacter ferrooxidans]|uniref:hypothetical protein n=1 Tax=Rhodobacter ferrooxidans TaxID=371731 RepID=UPI0018DB34A7|nr:hypothetical protein [Rhodobacter sp. SW2]